MKKGKNGKNGGEKQLRKHWIRSEQPRWQPLTGSSKLYCTNNHTLQSPWHCICNQLTACLYNKSSFDIGLSFYDASTLHSLRYCVCSQLTVFIYNMLSSDSEYSLITPSKPDLHIFQLSNFIAHHTTLITEPIILSRRPMSSWSCFNRHVDKLSGRTSRKLYFHWTSTVLYL